MSNKSIEPPPTSRNSLTPSLDYFDIRTRVKFDGQFKKQDKFTFTQKSKVNIYIGHTIKLWSFREDDDYTLPNALFDAAK